EAIYRAVLAQLVGDWWELVAKAVADPTTGWVQVERVLAAAFEFFENHTDFVRLAGREAIDGGPFFDEIATNLLPLFDRAVGFLEKEMRAGRLRKHNASQLLLSGYGAILSYFSDAPLITVLLGTDPLSPPARLCDREAIKALHRQLARLEAATTRATAAFDAGRDWEEDRARSSAAWIASACHLPTAAARRRVRLGRELRLMDVVEKAWLAGDIGEAQVSLLARA